MHCEVYLSKRLKILVFLTVIALCGLSLLIRSNHQNVYDIDAIDRLSFYRDNLPIGSTRAQVLTFLSQHPIPNFGTYGLQHAELGSLQYPLGEVRGPYYCSREVSYLYFVFSPKQTEPRTDSQSADDKLVEINLGGELQDCL
jgi:hypothetical protein